MGDREQGVYLGGMEQGSIWVVGRRCVGPRYGRRVGPMYDLGSSGSTWVVGSRGSVWVVGSRGSIRMVGGHRHIAHAPAPAKLVHVSVTVTVTITVTTSARKHPPPRSLCT